MTTRIKPLGKGKFAPKSELEKYVLERYAGAIAHVTGVPYLSERKGRVYIRVRLDCGDRILNMSGWDGSFATRADALIAIMETERYIEHISYETHSAKLRAILEKYE